MSAYGKVHKGPVKGADRCIAKTESDYGGCDFPRSAQIIDVIRCSVTFDDIPSFKKGLDAFRSDCLDSLSCDDVTAADFSANEVLLDVMRCKNGFNKCDESGIPHKYMDVKFNVVITGWDTHTREIKSVVGEVQFLLQAMLKSKLKGVCM